MRWFRRRTVNNRAGAMPGVSNPGVQSLFEFGVARGLGASKRAISEIMSRVIGAERGDTVKPRPAFLSHAVPKSSISSTSRITGFPGGSRRRATPPPRSRRRNCPAARRTASTSIISCESTSWRAAVPGRDRGSVIGPGAGGARANHQFAAGGIIGIRHGLLPACRNLLASRPVEARRASAASTDHWPAPAISR